jgi:hypothetical protein
MTPDRRRLEVYAADDGWRWRLKAGNGEIVATGEAHTREQDAERAARTQFPDLPLDPAPASTEGHRFEGLE